MAYPLARTHHEEDRIFLEEHGAHEAVVGEIELALELGRRALERFEVDPEVVNESVAGVRRSVTE